MANETRDGGIDLYHDRARQMLGDPCHHCGGTEYICAEAVNYPAGSEGATKQAVTFETWWANHGSDTATVYDMEAFARYMWNEATSRGVSR